MHLIPLSWGLDLAWRPAYVSLDAFSTGNVYPQSSYSTLKRELPLVQIYILLHPLCKRRENSIHPYAHTHRIRFPFHTSQRKRLQLSAIQRKRLERSTIQNARQIHLLDHKLSHSQSEAAATSATIVVITHASGWCDCNFYVT